MKTEGYIALMAFLLIGVIYYGEFQISAYHAWVKDDAIGDFEACMIFERDGDVKVIDGITGQVSIRQGKGEKYCKSYARNGDLYSPYPWWKAAVFVDPLTK